MTTAEVFLIAIGGTLGVCLVILAAMLFAKRMFFKQAEDDGY